MIGLDTNMLMRWLASGSITDAEGARQAAEITRFMNQTDMPVFVNHIVLVEIVWLLRSKVRLARGAIASFLIQVIEHPRLVVEDPEAVAASLQSYGQHPGDFADHLIGEINSRNGCRTTYTFDRAAARSPLFSELSR